MKKLSFFIACLVTLSVSQAQQDSTTSWNKLKKFNVTVRTVNQKTIYGGFYAINDSQVFLAGRAHNRYTVGAESIETFTLKRKNSVLRGALIGFGVGALTGVIIGFASGDDPLMEPSMADLGISAAINNTFAMTAKDKALLGGIGMGAGGALVGIIIGAVAKKKFIIGGKKEKFRDLQSELMSKLVQKSPL